MAEIDKMLQANEEWAQRCGVISREAVLDLYERRGGGLPPE